MVLDTSASMAYRLGGRTLLDRAREDVLEVLASLGPDEPATVVICGGEAVPQADPPGFDRLALRRLVADAGQGFAHSDLTTCVTAAVRALGDPAAAATSRRRLVVATDLTASAWRLDAPAPVVTTASGALRPEVVLLDAARGEPLGNRWVAGLVAEPEPAAGAHGYRIGVTLNGEGVEAERDVPLLLRVGAGKDERTALRSLLELPASGSTRKALAHDFAAGGPAVVTVALPPDALPEDDALTLVVDVPRDVKVLVVNGAPSAVRHRDAAYFLEAALSGPASPVRPTVVDAEGFAKARLADFDVVMLLDLRAPGPKAAELTAFVENGGGLFVAMGDDVDPDRYDAEVERAAPGPAPRGEDRGRAWRSRGRGQGGAARRDRLGPPGAPGLHRAGAGGARVGAGLSLHALQAGSEGGRGAGAGPLRRRRAGAGRGPARQGAGDALRLHPRPGVVRLDHPHELPARHAAHRRLAGRLARRAPLGARRGGRAAADRAAGGVLAGRGGGAGRPGAARGRDAGRRRRGGRHRSSPPTGPGSGR